MSDSVIAAFIGGGFSLLTAIATILLQGRIGRPRSGAVAHPSPAGPVAGKAQPPVRRFSASHFGTAVFSSILILVGVTLVGLAKQYTPELRQAPGEILILGGSVALLLFFAWGDAIFPLFARHAAFQLKILAVWAGIKISLSIEQPQHNFIEFFFYGWKLWALMAVIGGLAVGMMRRVRNRAAEP